MLPQDQNVVITVSASHIVVCRRHQLPNGSITYECARNADTLEADALLAIARSKRPFMTGQEFPCPDDLAARARWN